jgi:hypothetical protein
MKSSFKRSLAPSFAAAILVVAHMPICHAAIEKIGCAGKLCSYKISGVITRQDIQTAAHIPDEIPKGSTLRVVLDSPGGDVDAAIAIGRMLRGRGALAHILPQGLCASACVLLLAGATNRIVAAGARVGVHRLYTASTSHKNYDALQLEYRQLESKVKGYLREMNVPETLYDAMMQFPSENIHFLSRSELESYHLNAMDYVAEDLANSRQATIYGLSKPEYLRRSAQATQQCDHYLDEYNRSGKGQYDPGNPLPYLNSLNADLMMRYQECRESIFRGRK